MARNFPNFIDAFMEYTDYVEAPEKFLRWSALSIIAGALERKVWLTNGAATWYPNLYIMLVGAAGTSRKSTTSEVAIDLLREVPGIHFFSDQMNEVSLVVKLRSAGHQKDRVRLGSEEYVHSAVYLYSSEAANAFKEMYQGGGIIVMLTDLFNGGPRGWHHKHAWSRHTKGDGELKVFNPCLNILACSTPDWLFSKVMTKNDAEGGFGSRLLMVVHQGAYRKKFGWQQAGHGSYSTRYKLIEDLKHINGLQGPYEADPSFQRLFAELDEKHTRWLEERGNQGMVTGYQERKLTHAMKLSQVIAASKRDSLYVEEADLRMAWALLSDLEHDMQLAYTSLATNPEKRVYSDLWAYIERMKLETVAKPELIAAFQHKYSIKEVSNGVKDLIDAHKLMYVPTDYSRGLTYKVVRESRASVPEQSPLRLLP